MNSNKVCKGFVIAFSNIGQQFLGGSFFTTGDVHDVFGIDDQAVRVRNKLRNLSLKYNADIESIAVAWLIKLGALPLIGTTNEQRIKNIAAAFDINLDNQEWYELYYASKGEGKSS